MDRPYAPMPPMGSAAHTRRGAEVPLSPAGLGYVLNLDSAERSEAVYNCNADTDFGGFGDRHHW